MSQHISRRTGKVKAAYDTRAEARAAQPGQTPYVCKVCGRYHTGGDPQPLDLPKLGDATLRRGTKRDRQRRRPG